MFTFCKKFKCQIVSFDVIVAKKFMGGILQTVSLIYHVIIFPHFSTYELDKNL